MIGSPDLDLQQRWVVPVEAMRAITNEMVDRIAGEAVVTVATVARYLAGLPIRPGGRSRIEAALRKFRWSDMIRVEKKTGTDDA